MITEENLKLISLIKDDKFEDFISQTNHLPNLSTILDGHGENCLHYAAAKDNVDLLKYLISKKCYVNLVNFYSASPLYYAAMKNAKNAVKYLIDLKADPRITSAYTGKKPKEIATENDV